MSEAKERQIKFTEEVLECTHVEHSKGVPLSFIDHKKDENRVFQ